MAHRDEFLFQTIHQVVGVVAQAGVFRSRGVRPSGSIATKSWPAVRLLRRSAGSLDVVQHCTMMLEHIEPWGLSRVPAVARPRSGFDSPGFRVRTHLTQVGEAFHALLSRRRQLNLPRTIARVMASRTCFRSPNA